MIVGLGDLAAMTRRLRYCPTRIDVNVSLRSTAEYVPGRGSVAAAGGFDLLRRLFGQLTITNTVRDEVLAGGDLPGAAELAAAIRDGWIQDEHT